MTDKNIDDISDKKIIFQLISFAKKHRKIMQGFLEETGVFHGQYSLLMEISRNPNASQAELAKLMRVSPATIAVSLKKLENNGYINREIDEADNRLKKITISEKGNQVVMQSRQIFESLILRFLPILLNKKNLPCHSC